MERNTIIERTQNGKAIAKTKEGYKEGRPKSYTLKQINNAIKMLESNSYTEVAEITGISKSTLIREVRKRKENVEGLK
ncbi:helix-turn-helix domain-containing protein [Clostridium estertheticum]|uniref:helix-turn-helix domain-containing protein n=1 Tax=Clostridium estertheticum TaxID=238834 RepID=UPI0021F43049